MLSPKPPPVLFPHPTTSVVSNKAIHLFLHTAIFVTLLKVPVPFMPFTCTGSKYFVVLPCPNCPWSLFPHAQTEPSAFNASEKYSPAPTSITLSIFIFVGT